MSCPWRRAEALAARDRELRRLLEAALRMLDGRAPGGEEASDG